MKKLILASLLCLGFILGANAQSKQDRTVGGFTKIKVSSAIKLVITMGSQNKVTVEAEEKVINKILTEVKDGQLKVYSKESYTTTQPVVVYVTATELNTLQASGASLVKCTNLIKAKSFTLEASGASSLILELNADAIKMEVSGASATTIKGTALQVGATVSGASSLKLEELVNKEIQINASGASSAKVYASEILKANASGSSTIKYFGSPKDKNIETSGYSSIKEG